MSVVGWIGRGRTGASGEGASDLGNTECPPLRRRNLMHRIAGNDLLTSINSPPTPAVSRHPGYAVSRVWATSLKASLAMHRERR
jgi:hypothetical protein